VFRNPQFQLRGTVDDEFIGKCLSLVPDGSEYAVVDAAVTRTGQFKSSDFCSGKSHAEQARP
jgi:hypothetical protein